MRVLVTGATGTLGRILVDKLLEFQDHEVVGFSRDEQKQRTMPKHPRLEMIIGDVRDYHAVEEAAQTCQVIAHLAALKCVDTLEENPTESIKTNIIGTENVMKAARRMGIDRVVFTSTDKACYPVNVYGQSKAIAEKLVIGSPWTHGIVCRYGNVLGSRGSVLPMFVNSLAYHKKVDITDPDMTRFWETIDKISDFVLEKVVDGAEGSGVWVPSMKSSTVPRLAQAVAHCMGITNYGFNTIGMRPGEKIHETLITVYDDESCSEDVTSANCEMFAFDDLVEMINPIVDGLMSTI